MARWVFTKQAYTFDAKGLRASIEDMGRQIGVEVVVVREARKLLSVEFEFAATGSAEDLERLRVMLAPGGGGGSTLLDELLYP